MTMKILRSVTVICILTIYECKLINDYGAFEWLKESSSYEETNDSMNGGNRTKKNRTRYVEGIEETVVKKFKPTTTTRSPWFFVKVVYWIFGVNTTPPAVPDSFETILKRKNHSVVVLDYSSSEEYFYDYDDFGNRIKKKRRKRRKKKKKKRKKIRKRRRKKRRPGQNSDDVSYEYYYDYETDEAITNETFVVVNVKVNAKVKKKRTFTNKRPQIFRAKDRPNSSKAWYRYKDSIRSNPMLRTYDMKNIERAKENNEFLKLLFHKSTDLISFLNKPPITIRVIDIMKKELRENYYAIIPTHPLGNARNNIAHVKSMINKLHGVLKRIIIQKVPFNVRTQLMRTLERLKQINYVYFCKIYKECQVRGSELTAAARALLGTKDTKTPSIDSVAYKYVRLEPADKNRRYRVM